TRPPAWAASRSPPGTCGTRRPLAARDGSSSAGPGRRRAWPPPARWCRRGPPPHEPRPSTWPGRSFDGRPAAALYLCLRTRPELPDVRDHCRLAGIRQHADGAARHLVAKVHEQVEVLHLAFTGQYALQRLPPPRRAFAALGALRARFVGVEHRQAHALVDDVL